MVSFRQNQRTDEIRLDLVKIWPDLDESRQDRPRSRQILLDLCLRERGGGGPENGKLRGGGRLGRLESVFHAKTHQPTCRIWFLEVEIRR